MSIFFISFIHNNKSKKNPGYCVRNMLTNVKPVSSLVVKNIPIYHTLSNVNTYLTDVHHFTGCLHNNATLAEELCIFYKASNIEDLAKQKIFTDICGYKTLPIKTIYETMVSYNIIENNIMFNTEHNFEHAVGIVFFELKNLSKFATTHSLNAYFYQHGEKIERFASYDTRQNTPDAYVMYLSDSKLTFIKKGIDIKLGNL